MKNRAIKIRVSIVEGFDMDDMSSGREVAFKRAIISPDVVALCEDGGVEKIGQVASRVLQHLLDIEAKT